jgi:hypothetical protein
LRSLFPKIAYGKLGAKNGGMSSLDNQIDKHETSGTYVVVYSLTNKEKRSILCLGHRYKIDALMNIV